MFGYCLQPGSGGSLHEDCLGQQLAAMSTAVDIAPVLAAAIAPAVLRLSLPPFFLNCFCSCVTQNHKAHAVAGKHDVASCLG